MIDKEASKNNCPVLRATVEKHWIIKNQKFLNRVSQ